MFHDSAGDSININSLEDEQRYVRDSLVQTDQRQFVSRSTAPVRRKVVETQTDADVGIVVSQDDCDEDKLLAFLKKVEPKLMDVLDENLALRAFDGYELQKYDEDDSLRCLHTFQSTNVLQIIPKAAITSLSWNSSGSLVAATYGYTEHDDWCKHKSFLTLWSVDRTKPSQHKSEFTFESSSCFTAIHFHPLRPGMLACGLFSGDIRIYDTANDQDCLLITSSVDDASHKEPISQVAWVPHPSKHGVFNLVSSAQDGKILVWQIDERNRAMHICACSVLTIGNASMKSAGVSSDVEIGVSCISLCQEDPSIFTAGSENGGVFRCSFDDSAAKIIHSHAAAAGLEVHSAAQFAMEAHLGPVTSVDASQFHRNVVLTSSSDATIRIYNTLQYSPYLTIQTPAPVHMAAWCPCRPMFFATASSSGHLNFYDLCKNKVEPVSAVDVKSKDLFCLAFNSKRPQILATGSKTGSIQIWQISDSLISTNANEQEEFFSLFCK